MWEIELKKKLKRQHSANVLHCSSEDGSLPEDRALITSVVSIPDERQTCESASRSQPAMAGSWKWNVD